jgi:glucose-6-phosphate 1-dehydrogenase
MQTVMTELDLTYRRRFSDLKIPEAYESLILDAFKGDHSNFVRDDELDASWKIFTPLLHYLDDNAEIEPMEYPYGMLEIKKLAMHCVGIETNKTIRITRTSRP